ncbi:hypothetical protein cypCar_00014138 [Cyprinus carpio]|nr:hypothetical protein cypCar_00014138 [Cyprinus carpio]
MINELASHYTSRNNCSQDSLQNNGKKDQSLLKTSCITSSTAVKIDSVASAQKKVIMVDQDAPLDLSLRKIKEEDFEQDGVLDLSTKKNLSKDHTSLRNSHVSPATHLVKRDSIDLSLAQVKDLQSVNTLEHFMSKLCLHHQRQIVDALGFLQSEVKTVAASNHCQSPNPDLSAKQETTSCSYALFETSSDIQQSERTCSVDAAVSITGAGSSHGIFPSLQAERLKKHLKKFAIASPVKNNPKNQRLLSKALGQGISSMRSKEKHEPTTATRICTKAQSLAGVMPAQAPESLAPTAGSAKNPTSARILRKYSNMREKLQVQQNKKHKEKTFKGARLKASIIPKKANKQKLPTRKGSKSVVQRISSLTKTAKTNSALKQRALKGNQCHKDGASPKRLQALTRKLKASGS